MKFGNNRTTVDGRSFHSKLEAAVYTHLRGMEMDGEISDLRCQHSVYLTDARIQAIIDFSFIRGGELIYCEAKGFPTDVWRLKKKLWKQYGPGPLEIWVGTAKNFRLDETIIPRSGD